MNAVQREFLRRLEQVPVHGLGLSVDVYSPDLSSLLGSLRRRQVLPAYMEVFRATPAALSAVRQRVGDLALAYHGEGLWLTQPEAVEDPTFRHEVHEVAAHLRILESAWSNHECATKHMAGYSFGTYLPPLYTPSSAEVVAANARFVQNQFDQHCRLASGGSPLVLLEIPPLTYFGAGTLPIPTFFRLVTEQASCGLVLDVGHLWTLYRYTGAWRTTALARFVDEFLAEFPVERVVEIHVAGLAVHESCRAAGAEPTTTVAGDRLPQWTDAHMAPIPPMLFDMLDQILSHPRLTHLRGLALEVDTKPVELIVDEFDRFSCRYAAAFAERGEASEVRSLTGQAGPPCEEKPVSGAARQSLREAYELYARVLSGRAQPNGAEWKGPCAHLDELEQYRSTYLPYEILHWGGEIEAMFPESCRRLTEQAIPLAKFVSFWFREPRPVKSAYDFFLLKIERFIEFACEEMPELAGVVEREAGELRHAYSSANEPPIPAASETR